MYFRMNQYSSFSILFLFIPLFVFAQNIMKVWQNGELIEYDISTVDSITFEIRKPESIGIFSVSSNKLVAFSPGNLMYIPVSDTWLFAEHQYDYIGTRNIVNNVFSDTIDLFAWSTNTDLSTTFGVTLEDNNDLFTGDFVDWGTAIDDGNTWRTLTSKEWEYLRVSRKNAKQLIGVGTINGVNGLILLPDNWVALEGVIFKSGYSTEEYSYTAFAEHQSFTTEQWSQMQQAGAVFLPCAGFRIGTSLAYMQLGGLYWTSSPHMAYGPQFASYFLFMCDGAGIGYDARSGGNAVRLVKDL